MCYFLTAKRAFLPHKRHPGNEFDINADSEKNDSEKNEDTIIEEMGINIILLYIDSESIDINLKTS